MHTYRRLHDDSWLVGYYTMEAKHNTGAVGGTWLLDGVPSTPPSVVSTWQFLSQHATEQEAMERVNFLNGGSICC